MRGALKILFSPSESWVIESIREKIYYLIIKCYLNLPIETRTQLQDHKITWLQKSLLRSLQTN